MERDDILDDPIDSIESAESIEKPRRPLAITIVCILGFGGAVLSIPIIFSGLAKYLGTWFSVYLALSALIGLSSMIGLWKMKKWAVFLYLGLAVLSQVVLLNLGPWRFTSIVMPALILGISFYHFDKMD